MTMGEDPIWSWPKPSPSDGPLDLSTIAPFVAAVAATVIGVSFKHTESTKKHYTAFAVFVLIWFATQFMRQNTRFTQGFWCENLNWLYEWHDGTRIWPVCNVVPIALAFTGVATVIKTLSPGRALVDHVMPELRDRANFFDAITIKNLTVMLKSVGCPVLLASFNILMSVSFIVFVLLYLLGFCMILFWMFESEKKKHSSPTVTGNGKKKIRVAPTTHLRVFNFWSNHVSAKDEEVSYEKFCDGCVDKNAILDKCIDFLGKDNVVDDRESKKP